MNPTRIRLPPFRNPSPSRICPQQEYAAGSETAAAGHGDPGIGDLAFACLAAQLAHGLVDKAHAVGAGMGELAAMGVQRHHTVAGDVAAAVEEVLGLADAAEAEGFDP